MLKRSRMIPSAPLALTLLVFTAAQATPVAETGRVLISEVLYDPTGGDAGQEWVELFNAGPGTVDLSAWSLGYGGSDYTYGRVQLGGLLAPGGYLVIGGPLAGFTADFAPGLQNGGAVADAVGLFTLPAHAIDGTAVPVHQVIYGGENRNGLLDASGAAGAVDVADAPSGNSIALQPDLGWAVLAAPTPQRGPLDALLETAPGADAPMPGRVQPVPAPASVLLVLLGLGALLARPSPVRARR